MREVIHQGDIIVTPYKSYFGISHYAVFAGTCSQGINWAIHNIPETGVCWIKLDELLVKGCERIERFKGKRQDRVNTIEHAKSMIGRPYSLFKFNCEHFARWVKEGVCESKQVRTFEKLTTIVILFCIIYSVLKEKK